MAKISNETFLFRYNKMQQMTQKTDLYKTITLNLKDEYYNFTSSNKVNYDIEKGNIFEEESEEYQDGFFPLDTALLGDKSDLTSPYGSGSDMFNVYDGKIITIIFQ